MSSNILDSISSLLTPDVVGKAASALGESPAATGRAIAATVPAILGGLVRGSGDGNLISQVLGLLKSPENDGAILRNPGSMVDAVTGPARGTPDLGSSLLSTVFGGRLKSVTDVIGQVSGVRGGSAGSILSMLAPLVVGVLGDRVKRDNLDAGGLTRLLASNKDAVAAAMPSGLSSVLGLAAPAGEMARQVAGAAAAPIRGAKAGFNWTWLAAGAAVVAAIWFYARGGSDKPAAATVDSAAASVAAATSGMAADLTGRLALPGGVELNAPAGGTEHRMARFIADPNAMVNDTTWFDFDRLNFETGSSTLTSESREQLQNVASILTAYPNVHLKLGGYTDDRGKADANQALSQDRAETVKRELEVQGISPVRLAAEGYGSRHPVADNATAEGRAKNRRISLRVTKK